MEKIETNKSQKKSTQKLPNISKTKNKNVENPRKECVDIKKFFCEKRGAIVKVTAETILVSGTTLPDKPEPFLRADLKVTGNGFFVCESAGKFQEKDCKDCKCGKRKRYIVCPASVVLINPSVTSVTNRFPFVVNPPVAPDGRIKNQVIQASKILVTVPNVNCEGKTFVYDAELVGVSGSDDIALLKIKEECCPSTSCNPDECGPPKIKDCHPFLEFNKKCLSIGEKVYLTGSYTTEPFNDTETVTNPGIIEGKVVKPRFTDPSGLVFPEMILVNTEVYAMNVGLPIIDCCGKVVAMQTTNVVGVDGTIILKNFLEFVDFDLIAQGNGYVAGPISEIIVCIIGKILSSLCQNQTCCVWTESIPDDGAGNFVRVLKAYLGIAYKIVQPYMYNTIVDFVSGAASAQGLNQFLTDANGIVSNIKNQDRKITGIYVMGIAGANPDGLNAIPDGFWYVPGGTTGQATAPLSPTGNENNLGPSNILGTKIRPGTMIRKICDHKVGNNCDERAPSYWLSFVRVGNLVEIEFLIGGNNDVNFSIENQYTKCEKIIIETKSMPPLLDYPWGTNIFPKVLVTAGTIIYPAFLAPVNQTTVFEYPERIVTVVFDFIAGHFRQSI